MESNHLLESNQCTDDLKEKNIVKATINTRNSKRINTKMLKKRGHKIHTMWGKKVRKSRLFFLEYV